MLEIIKSHDDPRIKKFLGLKGISSDEFIIGEGFKIINKMNSTLKIQKILTSQSIYDENKCNIDSFSAPVYIAENKFICSHVGYKFHQGLFALANHPGYHDLKSINNNVLILNNLDNAENVGAIIRSALGLGFSNILSDERSCSPYLKRCIRVSMGNVFFANIYRSSCLVDSIEFLKSIGYSIYSAANEAKSFDYRKVIPKSNKIGIIIGNEGHGIEEEIKKISTGIIKIPVKESVEHLNAAAAGAILMSHFSSY